MTQLITDDTVDNLDNTDDKIYQCCARIGNIFYDICLQSNEFINKYPLDTYITNEGYIYGKECKTIIKNFNTKNNFLCDKHLDNDDIRKQYIENIL